MNELPTVASARLNGLFRIGEKVWADRPDLRDAFPSLESWEYWYWLMWHGTQEVAELKDGVFRSPPSSLTERVVGEMRPRQVHESGLVDWRRILLGLEEGGFDFRRGGSVLDFGTGCGRVLRFFGRYADSCDLHGADPDGEAIEWCRRELDFARFETLDHAPPSPFGSNQFDAVYAFSVFSHLPEERHLRWLEELHRVTKPRGVLVLTVMGDLCLDAYRTGARSGEFPPPETLRKDLAQIEQSGFKFYPYSDLALDASLETRFETWDTDQFGVTFILEHYIRRRWCEWFELVSFWPAPDKWQDYAILRRK